MAVKYKREIVFLFIPLLIETKVWKDVGRWQALAFCGSVLDLAAFRTEKKS